MMIKATAAMTMAPVQRRRRALCQLLPPVPCQLLPAALLVTSARLAVATAPTIETAIVIVGSRKEATLLPRSALGARAWQRSRRATARDQRGSERGLGSARSSTFIDKSRSAVF